MTGIKKKEKEKENEKEKLALSTSGGVLENKTDTNQRRNRGPGL